MPLDLDWPVVESYWSTEKDQETGQSYPVYYERRVAPSWWPRPPEAVIQAQCAQIHEALVTQSYEIGTNINFNCVYIGPESMTRVSTDNKVPGSNYVRNTLKSYAYLYCHNGDCACSFYAMWRDETYWYRTHTNWTLKSAVHSWGCPATCQLCNGQVFDDVDVYNIGTAGWQCPGNCNNSTVYGFNKVWPAGQTNPEGLNPKEKVSYRTYYDGVYRKSLTTVAEWD